MTMARFQPRTVVRPYNKLKRRRQAQSKPNETLSSSSRSFCSLNYPEKRTEPNIQTKKKITHSSNAAIGDDAAVIETDGGNEKHPGN